MSAPDWSKFTLEADDTVVLSPCLALALHLEQVHEEGILDFYERSREALGALMAFASAGETRFRKVTSRTLGTVPSWKGKMTRPRAGLQLNFSPVEHGVGPASLELFVSATPHSSEDPKVAAKGRKDELVAYYEKYGDVNVFTSADLRVSFPVDHPLVREPSRMRAWVQELRLVREGRFASGECGFALNIDHVTAGVSSSIDQRLAVLCRQYPALEFGLGPGLIRLLRYDGPSGKILHKVRRASWLTLLSGNCIEQLGGQATLQAALGSGPAVLQPLENGAVLLQAEPEPRLGDVSQHDLLPGWRQVARAIRPVRVDLLERTPTGDFNDWAQEWLEAFDRESA